MTVRITPRHAPRTRRSRAAPASDAAASSEPRTPRNLGVEEEFHLVDTATRRLAPRAPELLERLGGGSYVAEMQECVIETNTDVCSDLSTLRDELLARRRTLVETAADLGLSIVAAGAVPLAVPAELQLTDTPRYRRMLADYQLLAREQLICGTQVHAEIPDRTEALAVAERIAGQLPVFLALSCSSPYWADGSDTGYASARTLVWSRWPTTGLSSGAATADAFDALVQELIATGVITDPGMIYFDIRPAATVPTLELRICDSCPSVDTIVLIAGLYRALVDRALAEHRQGLPVSAVPPALGRAASWRAARSGLEGDLVDLATRRSRPAADVVRDLVAGLEAELRASEDWETVTALTDTLLLAGSSAARQRRAFRRRGRLTDVVDLLIAETAGDGRAGLDLPAHTLLESYFPLPEPEAPAGATRAADPADLRDEAVDADGRVRPLYREVMTRLAAIGATGLRHRWEGIESLARAEGITFRAGDEPGERVFPLDIVPRLIDAATWRHLAAGAAQRARALDLFLRDVYGAKAILEDGVVPPELLDLTPGFRSSGRLGGRSVRAQVCGLDLVQDHDGTWRVLEDNVRIPSGAAYAVANRELIARFLPEVYDAATVAPVEAVPLTLWETLRASAPARAPEDPLVVVLTSGPDDAAYAEHVRLASAMGIPLVTPRELAISRDGASVLIGGRELPVHVLYLRIDEDMLMTSEGADGRQLRGALVDALHRGHVTLANALGNGVADDKAMYAYVPAMIEYYLGEPPILPSVPTYLCSDREQRDHVLANLDALVTKPVDGYGGHGVLIGPEATDLELARRRRDLTMAPERYIAQEVVRLSSHPTFDGAALRPHHVDLRVFVHLRPTGRRADGEPASALVPPAALTRVGPAGSSIVNSSAGGSSKDTWVLTEPAEG